MSKNEPELNLADFLPSRQRARHLSEFWEQVYTYCAACRFETDCGAHLRVKDCPKCRPKCFEM